LSAAKCGRTNPGFAGQISAADHHRTDAVAVAFATETVAVAIPIKIAVTIPEVAIAVPEHSHIVVIVVEASPHPDAVVEKPSTYDPNLLGEAELLMGQSGGGSAAGAHRVGAVWNQRCAKESRGGHCRKQALVHFG